MLISVFYYKYQLEDVASHGEPLKVGLYHFVMKILNGYNFLVVDPIVLI